MLLLNTMEANLLKLKTAFMNEHPLRSELNREDWQRIQTAIDTKCYDAVSADELDAATDLLYDTVAGEKQTHLGVVTLQ